MLSMKKKLVVGLTLFGLIGIIAYLGYSKYMEITKSTANPLQAIPNNAAVIVKSDNWRKSWSELEACAIWQQISKNDKWQYLKSDIANTQNIIETSEDLKKLLSILIFL